jgi:hypothetical protein
MSRAIIHTPVVTVTSIDKTAKPAPVQTSAVVHDAICHQYSGTQTAVPEMPPN